jgi:hypothetical protein
MSSSVLVLVLISLVLVLLRGLGGERGVTGK